MSAHKCPECGLHPRIVQGDDYPIHPECHCLSEFAAMTWDYWILLVNSRLARFVREQLDCETIPELTDKLDKNALHARQDVLPIPIIPGMVILIQLPDLPPTKKRRRDQPN